MCDCRKKDEAANPNNEGKKHEEAKKRHAKDYDVSSKESQQEAEGPIARCQVLSAVPLNRHMRILDNFLHGLFGKF